MKITTLSAVLCVAASTALADKSTLKPIENANTVGKRADPGVQGPTIGRPLGVIRHEQQGGKSKHGHKEHHIEAHRDGKSKSRNDDKESNEDSNSDQDEDEVHEQSEDSHHEEHDDDEKEEKSGSEKDEEQEVKGKKSGVDKQDKQGSDAGSSKESSKGQGADKSSENKGGAAKDSQDGSSVTSGPKDGSNDKSNNGAQGGTSADSGVKNGNNNNNNNNGAQNGSNGSNNGVQNGSSGVTNGNKNGSGNAAAPNSAVTDVVSPLWLVQPYGASVWEQGRTYVISWGPNPDPVYAKAIKPKSPVDVRLMQGTPENLREIAVLKTGVDSDLHFFQWTIPASVVPAKDYSIRLTHQGDVDTYSHYFEVVKAGDPRSNKSNVGEPLQMPQKGDTPQHTGKGPMIKPAAPPNPLPADNKPAPAKPVDSTPPAAAKPVDHKSAAVDNSHKNANMLGIALTLFGAVYLL
ncbi:hypothetical protein B0O80DRAFT_492288 [Mortierella sp. GBAus27b]|nr:hypothetical protein BGX31_002757 [Mortierella sp. GBA43]KAI8363125.1 hypothetical protein B0O80DRAFT_492288 [Mortierella sp. GBAus27b]